MLRQNKTASERVTKSLRPELPCHLPSEFPCHIPTRIKLEGTAAAVKQLTELLSYHGFVLEQETVEEQIFVTSIAGIRIASEAGDPAAVRVLRRSITLELPEWREDRAR
jgi:hypothetical protein